MVSIRNPGQTSLKRHLNITDSVEAQSLPPNLRATKPETEPSKLFEIFTKRDSHWTIFDKVTSLLPVADVLSLQRTCKATAPIYGELQKTQWSIDGRLQRFFRDLLLFRWTLGMNDALVSGSFALQFFGKPISPLILGKIG